jgi:uncharacterized protein (DUF2236 family)
MLSMFRGFPRAPEPGRPGDPGIFEPDSVPWRVNGETIMLLGGPRALLMQIAHPAVAAGVADHSDFPEEPYQRLWRTLDAMLTISFGDRDQSAQMAERVTAVHRRVNGQTPDGVPYDALDPELLLWVHATGTDTALVTYKLFVSELTRVDRERYYEDMKRQAVALETPAAVLPQTLADFERYVERTCATLEISDQARRLARDILSPPVPLALQPVSRFLELITTGLLPLPLREGYGLRWSSSRERLLHTSVRSIRGMLPFLPAVLRRWPHARGAAKRAAAKAPVAAAG